jgi:hypothetical protein
MGRRGFRPYKPPSVQCPGSRWSRSIARRQPDLRRRGHRQRARRGGEGSARHAAHLQRDRMLAGWAPPAAIKGATSTGVILPVGPVRVVALLEEWPGCLSSRQSAPWWSDRSRSSRRARRPAPTSLLGHQHGEGTVAHEHVDPVGAMELDDVGGIERPARLIGRLVEQHVGRPARCRRDQPDGPVDVDRYQDPLAVGAGKVRGLPLATV